MTKIRYVISIIIILFCVNACAATIQIEGENYTKVGGPSQIRIVERATASAGKVVSYWEEQGVWLEWEFDVPVSGSYVITFRYACGYSDTYRRIEIDGKLPSKNCENVRFETTGSWPQHSMFTLCNEQGNPLVISLSKGRYCLKMTNVNSRGLAIDLIYVHDPRTKFIDVGVTESDVQPFKPLMLEQSVKEAILTQDKMSFGLVNAVFDSGGFSSVYAGSALFTSSAVSSMTEKPILKKTKNLLIRMQVSGNIKQIYVTDGRAFYIVYVYPDSPMGRIPVWPRFLKSEGNIKVISEWKSETGAFNFLSDNRGVPSQWWSAGDFQMNATGKIYPVAEQNNKYIVFEKPGRICALKIMPKQWADATGLNVGVKSDRNFDTLVSSVKDFPALSAFYEYGRFTLSFEWTEKTLNRCTVKDLTSGEVIQLDLL